MFGAAPFIDRVHAGEQLAERLTEYTSDDVVVLALPRGGVILGAEVARELEAPLGVVLVRKIGHPYNPEYAIGAVVDGQEPMYNTAEVGNISDAWLRQAEQSAFTLNEMRKKQYYGDGLNPPTISGRTVILVDDGIATGLSMEAAIHAARDSGARTVIVAAPVAAAESLARIEDIADEVIVLLDPDEFRGSVGNHYERFEEVTDQEVKALLWEVNHDVPISTTAPR